ncbi:hypothetical protein ACSCBZ_46785 [Streptomyces niveiscabiei]|uniref:hypothetical protein n=1 Tax=Streptomyces niveiscabiei TaxID=164115 RepID=UPI0006EBB851|nr:hypothetical protein [Streptomyces niveiscabiei]
MNSVARPHPLAAYADRIDPAETYTVRRLAALMDAAASSVVGMAVYGWLPGSQVRPHQCGGREYTWTGHQLLRIAGRPIRISYDHTRYSPATLYRVGCRCPVCVRAHSADSVSRRHALAEEKFPAAARTRLLDLVSGGTPVAEAAQEVGVTIHQVYGRATRDPGFGEALDEAGWSLCALGADHPACGTATGYKQCSGTGCREWRRAQARVERASST